MASEETPLVGPPPVEVPLSAAPLVRVIAQVRFPLIASVDKRDFIAGFQERIRSEYPVLRPEQTQGVMIGPQPGAVAARNGTIWRFHNVQSTWIVSLAPDFMSLETTSYESRDDFLHRFGTLLTALREELDVAVVDRLGVRYIDRLAGEYLANLPKLVRAEVAGVTASPLVSNLRQSVTHSVFSLPDGAGQLMARWGTLPPHTTVDPGAIPPLPQPSWILDIDAFLAETRAFDTEAVLGQARGFAERIYSVFRWAVTNEFLRAFGGQV